VKLLIERSKTDAQGEGAKIAVQCQALAVVSTVTLVRLQDTAAAYRAVALARVGRRSRRRLRHWMPLSTPSVALRYLRQREVTSPAAHPFSLRPMCLYMWTWFEKAASAIAGFRTMNPADQVRVLQRQADRFEALLVDCVRAATDTVVSFVPMMKGVQIDAIEDEPTVFIHPAVAGGSRSISRMVGRRPIERWFQRPRQRWRTRSSHHLGKLGAGPDRSGDL
jgi:hypothetical protein